MGFLGNFYLMGFRGVLIAGSNDDFYSGCHGVFWEIFHLVVTGFLWFCPLGFWGYLKTLDRNQRYCSARTQLDSGLGRRRQRSAASAPVRCRNDINCPSPLSQRYKLPQSAVATI
jgi:hypothetical protein